MKRLYVYDLETLYNFFSYTGMWEDTGEVFQFEISDRKNERDSLFAHLTQLQQQDIVMVGYNNIGFDYPILHQFMLQPYTFDAKRGYDLAQQIISQGNYGQPGALTVKFMDRLIPQMDIMRVNHFHNKNKRTRLKQIQVAMRLDNVDDLLGDHHGGIPFGVPLTHEQMDRVLEYNLHDVRSTTEFVKRCHDSVKLRFELLETGALQGDVLNFDDTKIGAEMIIKMIGRHKCFSNGKPRQSIRSKVSLGSVILPNVQFTEPEFQKVKDWFSEQVVHLDDESRPKLEVPLAKIPFVFGLGGVHASVENRIFESTDTHVIKDVDVAGMYVAVGLANGFYPEHLGQDFVSAYRTIPQERAKYDKGTALNKTFKLAGNAAYGNSNNPFSPFFDPKYTYTVTVNGQLQLLMLVERLSLIPGLEMIQANTDGITAYVPRDVEHLFNFWCSEWEDVTKLKLEHTDYKKMWIANVNSYLAMGMNGTLKRKKDYWYPESNDDYEGVWNKDFSNLSKPKCAEFCMLTGAAPKDAIRMMTNPHDFTLSYKTTGSAKVYIGDKMQPGVTRYYVSTKGEPMYKIANPKGEVGQYKRKSKLSDAYFNKIMNEIGKDVWDERVHTKNKSRYEIVKTSIESGRLVKECNRMSNFDWSDVDWDYYIKEVEKICLL